MKNISYQINQHVLPSKLTPQVKLLRDELINRFDNNEFTLKDVEASVSASAINTRQEPARIFSYYQNELVELGIMSKFITTSPAASRPPSKKQQLLELLDEIETCDPERHEEIVAEMRALID